MFRILASADCQLRLYDLASAEKPVAETELACQIAAQRYQVDPEKISDDKINRAYIRLIHVYLPWLRDLNIIERNEDKVGLTDHEQTDQLFEAAALLDAGRQMIYRRTLMHNHISQTRPDDYFSINSG